MAIRKFTRKKIPVLPHMQIGARFGFVTVISLPFKRRPKVTYVMGRCDCGMERHFECRTLFKTPNAHCGCRTHRSGNLIHGMSQTRIYRAWSGMLTRCANPNSSRYADYGGRGIKVCQRWRKFEDFLADMGERPPGMSLDRIDNDGDYEPRNCRWATNEQQSSNARSNNWLTCDGRTMTVSQWSREVGITDNCIRKRIQKGWEAERAIKTKPRRWPSQV